MSESTRDAARTHPNGALAPSMLSAPMWSAMPDGTRCGAGAKADAEASASATATNFIIMRYGNLGLTCLGNGVDDGGDDVEKGRFTLNTEYSKYGI